MAITLKEAKKLSLGQIIYSDQFLNADGTAQRWRVNGKVKTWIRSPERINVPLKHGLYAFSYLTEDNLSYFNLKET